MVRVFESPDVPFMTNIDLRRTQKIYIKGRVPGGVCRFTIYLQHGKGYEPSDIEFALDFRFNYLHHVRRILATHRSHGTWQGETGEQCAFPLQVGESFEIKIIVDDDSFIVKVGGVILLDYPRRSLKTNCLRIDKDVQLFQVMLK